MISAATAISRDRLEAVCRPHAGAWLAAFPSKNLGLWLQSSEFVAASRLWRGLCSRFERQALLKTGAGMYGRHHSLRDVLFMAASSASLRSLKEVMVDTSGRRPADVYIPDWSQGGPLAIDVTVSNPSQITTALAARDGLSASELAALAKIDQKESLYASQCAAQGVTFMAVPVCCYGGWLTSNADFVRELASRAAAANGYDRSLQCARLWQRLSLTLWRGNARQLLRMTA